MGGMGMAKCKAMRWAWAAAILLLAAHAAPAATAFLGENSPPGATIVAASLRLGEADANANATPGCAGLCLRNAAEFFVAPSASSPRFSTWNEFQSGTAGQFSSRAEAATAWQAYKQANGIVTGTTRSMAARSQYLRSLADDYRTPSWMKPWLEDGRVPPGYDVDHIEPLSVGGSDTPANMRLQGTDLHRTHHQYYRPWE